jgi:xanthine dehydrogenase accessory factor
MLVFPDGSQRGTLGGGCVEAEVKRRALGVLATGGRPDVLTFCLDDNYGWDDGLICGGRMTILADPLATSANGRREVAAEYYGTFRRLIDSGLGCTEAVVLKSDSLAVGDRCLFDSAGQVVARLANAAIPEEIARDLTPLEERPRPSVRRGVAFLPILPRITLFIVGGGHVGQAVARLASELDFDIWVLDDRAAYASPERFPTASRQLVGDIGVRLKEMAGEITPAVYALIVTRGHAHDEEALYHLATTPAGYVGMIGSKRKIKLIYEDLLARDVPAEALSRVHAPLGFAIGAQTVLEIAVSILAELIARRNLGRTLREARVHVPVG